MAPYDVLQRYKTSDLVGSVAQTLPGTRSGRLHLKGLAGSSRAFVAAALYEKGRTQHLLIQPDKESAAYLYNDLEQILLKAHPNQPREHVLFFPSSFKRGFEAGVKDNEGLLARTEVLNRLFSSKEKFILVTYPDAIAEKVVNRPFFEKNTLKLTRGEAVSLDFILDLLVEYEFERVDFVIEPGQFSLRGGLIDVYSFSGDHPYRIEFVGERVDSIRSFDPSSQLSIEKKESITIVPDIRIDPDKRIDYTALFDFLPKSCIVWIDDASFLCDVLDKQPQNGLFLTREPFLRAVSPHAIIETGSGAFFSDPEVFLFSTVPQPVFNKNFDLLINDLRENTRHGYHNILLADNLRQSERLASIIDDITSRKAEEIPVDYETLHFTIHEGFIDRDLKLACYTDHQIFERYHRYHLRDGYTVKESLSLKELYDLKPGDLCHPHRSWGGKVRRAREDHQQRQGAGSDPADL